MIVGARLQDQPEMNEGNAFVYFGGDSGISATPDQTLDNPADEESGQFGYSVATAGDVDADGYADIIIGARLQDAPETSEGNAFVYHGSPTGISTEPDQTLDNPTDHENAQFGRSVASAGDVNGDGYCDLIIGAPVQAGGAAFMYFGSARGIPPEPDQTVHDSLNGGGSFGASVASAGDANGDGYPDMIIGAEYQSAPEWYEGNAYVYVGSSTGILTDPDKTLDNPTDQENARFGTSVH